MDMNVDNEIDKLEINVYSLRNLNWDENTKTVKKKFCDQTIQNKVQMFVVDLFLEETHTQILHL